MSRRATLVFLALGVAWGIPYLLIKVAVAELPPVTLVAGRTLLAALILLPIAVARGAVLPTVRRWRPVLAYTVVEIALPWLFLTRAEQELPSSTTGLLIAAVPVVGVVLAVLIAEVTGEPHDRLAPTALLGLALGVAGVAALVGLDVRGSSLTAVGEVAVVVVGYAVGPVIMARRLGDLPVIGVVAVCLAGAGLGYLPAVLLGPGLPSRLPSGPVVAAVVLLAVVCTALAFVLLFELVRLIGPVRATAITYLNPAVAVVAGAVVLDERITHWTLLGFGSVLVGSWLVTRRPSGSSTVLGPRLGPEPHPQEGRR